VGHRVAEPGVVRHLTVKHDPAAALDRGARQVTRRDLAERRAQTVEDGDGRERVVDAG
jgi:hypothetical protein